MPIMIGHVARRLVLGAAIALAPCAVSVAQTQAQPAAAHQLDQDTAEALRRMSATIAAARGFTVRVHTLREGRMGEQSVLLSATAAIAARRPNRVAASVGSDLGNFSIWYDGRAVTVMNRGANAYGTTPLTGSLDQAVTWLEDRMGIELPVRPLLMADPYAAMLQAGPTTGRFVGRTVVGTTPADHFALRNPSFDWEIWLEATDRALPRRVSIRRSDGARTTMEFDQWNLNPRLPDSVFTFVPPRGAVAATVQLRPERGGVEVSR